MEIVTAPHLAVRNEWLALQREAPWQPEPPILIFGRGKTDASG